MFSDSTPSYTMGKNVTREELTNLLKGVRP